MRSAIPLLLAAILAGCWAAPPPPAGTPLRSPSGQRAFDNLIAGKVPQAPVNCIPSYNTNEMSIIDGHTLGFRVGTGSNRAYLVRLTPGCEMIGGGNYALVSRKVASTGLCRGDIQQVVDTLNNINVGSCTVAEIVPYVRR
jgi:hypothetical protein